MLLKILTLIFLNIVFVSADKVFYDEYSLFKIIPQDVDHFEFVKKLKYTYDGLDFWKVPREVGDFASVIVPPDSKHELQHSLTKRNIPYDVTLHDVQKALNEQTQGRVGRTKRDVRNELFWTNYQTMDDIYAWFYHLAETHSDVVSIIYSGKSFEGRNITGVRISRGVRTRAFYVDGGQVAADWLSPTVVTYLVDQLVRGEDPEAKAATEEFEWHIFPILNPDGHEFTQERERLWIKNRRRISNNAVGVDLSRNWNSQWGVRGGSFSPADSNFVGLGPFSEEETRAASRYIESIGSRLVGLLSFRGFGQRLLIPFAHTTDPLYNYNEMVTIGRRAMGSLSVRYNTQYLVDTSAAVHDGSTGVLADWAKHRFNPPVAATYLLRDDGSWGYTLPVNQVLPTCQETYDSIMAIIREAQFINVL